jgi:hypothetical protein
MSLRRPPSCLPQQCIEVHFPAIWKKAELIVIPKQGKDSKCPQNKRPYLFGEGLRENNIGKNEEIFLEQRIDTRCAFRF